MKYGQMQKIVYYNLDYLYVYILIVTLIIMTYAQKKPITILLSINKNKRNKKHY